MMWFKIVYSLGLRRPLRAGCGGSDACMLYGTALCANGWAFVPDVLWAGSCLLDFGPSVLCLVVCLPDLWHVNPSTAPAAGCCRWAPISCHPMTSPECSSPRQQSGLREPAGSGAVQLSCLMLPSKPIGCPTAMGGCVHAAGGFHGGSSKACREQSGCTELHAQCSPPTLTIWIPWISPSCA